MINFVLLISLNIFICIHSLSIYPDHTKPCLPKDEWTEDCLKCFCTDERKVVCQRTYCLSKLYLELDKCNEGDTMIEGCTFCTCINKYYVCEYEGCSDDTDEDED